MDNPSFWELPNAGNGFKFDDEPFLSSYEQPQYLTNGIKHNHLDLDVLDNPFASLSPSPYSLDPSSTTTYETGSPDDDDSDPVLKFLNQILIEETMEEKPSMFHDPLALQATERSLYDIIGQTYPPSPYNPTNNGQKNSDSSNSFYGRSSEHTNNSNGGNGNFDPGEYISSHLPDFSSNSVSQISSKSSFGTFESSDENSNIQTNSLESTNLLQNIFSDSESILQFKRGMEEASKFLPTNNQLIIDLDKYELPQKSDNITSVLVKKEKDEINIFSNGLKGRKHHYPENDDSEDNERSNKQSATYIEDIELSEMFDKVLLCTDDNGVPVTINCNVETLNCSNDTKLPSQVDKTPNGSNRGKARAKKNESSGDSVDLTTLLNSCAQSVASDDHRTAYEQLRQLRQHSSSTGDAYQRLANVFANGIEARLGGTGAELYASLATTKITAAEKLQAYHAYLSACPFNKISIFYANMMIGMNAFASEATTVHIIDFGILYGFQWPILIQHIAQRPSGSPKLRITGIELPQPGFRPLERIEATGVRLKRYCERFGVPFEYQAIAVQNWETINIEDLKIKTGEFLAVNCLFRFGKLPDETVVVDKSPRDAVLKLIRKMKPNIFVNAIINGSFNAPFFASRFKEALFHYSALFDMFDSTLLRENPHRMHFEQDFYGREVINVIACEGAERVEKPETYKQWQARIMRAGFKSLPLDEKCMKKLRHKVSTGYHKNFLFDDDGKWMLQGWKGRIMVASSCWVPA